MAAIGEDRKAWVFVVSEQNWDMIEGLNIHGVPEGSKAPSLVGKGDYLVFYVAKRDAKSLGGMFVGVYRATSTWFWEDKPLWPDEGKEGKAKYPHRVRVEPVKVAAVSFQELVPKLRFVEKKDRANAYLVRTPANLSRPIPQEDLKVILRSMR
jgi:predicted RNA-binding protein